MRKKIIAFLLVAAVVIGITPLMPIAEEGDTVTVVRGDTTYTLSADPDTGTMPAEFGTAANNGRIWTDKSVEVDGDRFNVNLQVLAQEYISTTGSGVTTSIAADVVMIFDLTQSMTDNKITKTGGNVTRLEALVDAANEAIDIITNTNVNNRITVYTFHGNVGSPTVTNVMPLAHYTSTSTQTDTNGKYLVYSNKSVKSSNYLLKDGESFSFTKGTGTGTDTQYGIAAGVDGLVDTINAQTDHSIKRKPYVILLSDGEPTSASKNWYSDDLSQLKLNTITTGSGGHRDALMATCTILTAAHRKDKLEAAYTAYNGGKQTEVEWFNIGIDVDEPSSPESAGYNACLLNPNYLVGLEGSNSSTSTDAQKVKYYLNQPDYAPAYTVKDYYENDNYVYIHEGDGYATFANTYDVLMGAFTTLAQIIQQGSMEITFPIIIHEGSGEQTTDVVFTDVIGDGMFVTDVTLTPDGADPVAGVDDGNGNYTFHGYDTTVKVTEDENGQQTLVWRLPAHEVAMFTFADRDNVLNGEYIAADPTRLTYGVDFTADIDDGPAYTNAFDSAGNPLTTVSYEIPGDNDYYYDVVLDNLANFVSSTLKTDINESTAKTENTTQSATDSSAYNYTAYGDGTANSYASVEGRLGNNGKATFLSRKETVEISVEKKWEDRTGGPITDLSGLPPVTFELCRMVQGGDEEIVSTFTLTASDGYTADFTLPSRDADSNRYTYYVREECPDGYYTASTTPPLTAEDGTMTLVNRESFHFASAGLTNSGRQFRTPRFNRFRLTL